MQKRSLGTNHSSWILFKYDDTAFYYILLDYRFAYVLAEPLNFDLSDLIIYILLPRKNDIAADALMIIENM